MANPSISVLIVNYNAGDLLTAGVGRVLSANQDIEVLVGDNGSADDSLARLEAAWNHDRRLHIFRFHANPGFAATANRLTAQAQGEYLLFLNPDCLVEADTLKQFSTLMAQHPRAGMAGAAVYDGQGRVERACRRRVPTPGRSLVRVLGLPKLFPHQSWAQGFEYQNSLLPVEPQVVEGISGACMFVRRTALAQVGPLDEGYFLHCEDLDWFMRFRAAGWEIVFAPHIRVTHHQGACSQSQPLRVLWFKHRGMLRFYHKFFRRDYSRLLLWLVSGAVWIRFGLLSGYLWLRKGLRKLDRSRF